MSRRIISRRGVVKQIYDYFLVLDFEATCLQNAKMMPCQEIIEFPVAKLNSSTLEVDSIFHEYVRPTERPELSTFCTELTGIIQEMVDKSDPLPVVLNSFERWIDSEGLRNDSFAFVTCGDWDLQVQLRNEAAYKNLALPSHFSSWINVKKSFCELTGTFPKGMKDILKHMNTELQGRHHSGIDDVRNIVEITRWLVREGHVLRKEDSKRTFGVTQTT
ncbi:hypothetical protein PFISCL1PPCAC_15713 [Pristionchus fissidentatus]|uniref:Exonuclease domain-containing protein n=1 Tax=Pristionchus fissidentatus TaxID=1538716 RepID=A0AAV5VXY2_9BILA|nr:hypothetical protein PFISCL1PPCAC_15713 [Pristionchus fissidentatus]